MATHSSVLAWRIPGMGEPGGLPSLGRTESNTTEATWQQQRGRKAAQAIQWWEGSGWGGKLREERSDSKIQFHLSSPPVFSSPLCGT